MINGIDVTRGYALLTAPQKVFESSLFMIESAQHNFVHYVQKEGVLWLQEVVLHKYVDGVTMCVIFVNIVVLLLESYK